jgi:peptidoglycan hydrolase-like protein with peptidoglycan-binding domain
MRESASESSSTVMIIKGGEPVTVTSSSGGWSRVKFSGRKGYIRSDLLVQITKSGYIPLELGNDCPQVKTVQERLRDLGYFAGTCDGEFLDDTLAAVREFQRRNGIKADGIAGGETQRTMFSQAAKAAEGVMITPDAASAGASLLSGAGAAIAGPALKKGDSGTSVLNMQLLLRSLGYIDFTPDGVFGTGTETAVKAFQANNGLMVDGKAGQATLALLSGVGATAAPTTAIDTPAAESAVGTIPETTPATSDTLKKGDTGEAVRRFQVRLQLLGYITFIPDGVFGSGTERAVVLFQQRNGLTADGKVGPATLAALNSSSALPIATASPTAAPSETVTLKRGDSGSDVTKMQKRLRELGYITFTADGEFGSGTRDAVIAFQKNNGLSSDGIAGPGTLTLLYSSSAKKASAAAATDSPSVPSVAVPNVGQVKLLHFFNDVKPKYPSGTTMTIYDPASGLSWKLRVISMGRHADAEPLTATDTADMRKAFGTTTWTPKAVWIKFPDGVWSLATTHNTPHLSQTIKNNNFEGHLCVHFLRDMSECQKNDPNYGVQHQKAIRAAWKALTGQTVN